MLESQRSSFMKKNRFPQCMVQITVVCPAGSVRRPHECRVRERPLFIVIHNGLFHEKALAGVGGPTSPHLKSSCTSIAEKS